jgi:thiosulfate/3-mercaptopyruvate sulfurtransferase
MFRLGILFALMVSSALPAQAPIGKNDSVVVSTQWLAEHLKDPGVVVIQMMMGDTAYRTARIPGAQPLKVNAIIATVNDVEWEPPAVQLLDSVFASVGVSDNRRVVLYGAPMAVGRAFMTLELLGHQRVSMLDGGLEKWQAEGRATTLDYPAVPRGKFTPRPRADVRVDAKWVQGHLERRGFVLLDTRTLEEFEGRGMRHGLAVDGHLPGARHLVWQSLFASPAHLLLKDRASLDSIFASTGATKGDTLVTYCAVGARASISYMIARHLGYDVRLYDGSYMEWAHSGLPVVK